MEESLFGKVRDLLLQAKSAHGEYEASELGGQYDEAWATWYAQWLLKHGINETLAQTYGVDSLSRSLSAMAEAQKTSSYASEKWADFYASTLLHEAK